MHIKIDALKNSKPIGITYADSIFKAGDTETKIYDTYKLSILLTDNLVAILPDKLIGGKKGDVLLFNPSEIHFGRFLKQGQHRFLELYIPSSFFSDVFKSDKGIVDMFDDNSDNRVNCLRGNIKETAEIIDVAEKIVSLTENYDPQSDIEIFMNVLRIFIIASKLYAKSKETIVFDAVTPSHVLAAIEYISNHYSEKISVDDIASEIGCSVAYLSRLFKKYAGTSLYNYLVEYRVNMATTFLRADCSVTEVCYQVGFNDCSNFIEKFKNIMGVTPYQYKKMLNAAT